ncbi:MAG: amidohydrolase family protein [Burkholderiales bacterium]|nr:amidohydrolase family protein [Burkholderiales bacterium]
MSEPVLPRGELLIRRAELDGARLVDVLVGAGRVFAIAPQLPAGAGARIVDARGAALLPGLHDHHLHLRSLAAAMLSLRGGPRVVRSEGELAAALAAADALPERQQEWLSGVGYHDCVAGEIDRDWLDRHARSRPVRIQHRSGRLWILNSRALDRLADAQAGAPLERVDGRATGRLYDGDGWLRERLAGQWPDLRAASVRLASRGLTGLTDGSPDNDIACLRHFEHAQHRGELLQDLLVMGDATLAAAAANAGARIGPLKVHLREAALPEFDSLVARVRESHAAERPVAVHCVTCAELLLALEALRVAGARPGDRIEHASVTPPEALPMLRDLGLCVVTQPHFILERGDEYLREVDAGERAFLYRLRSLRQAGIPLAGGSDAPFGDPDPWRAMQAAVERRTAGGLRCGVDEAITPEQALALYLGGPHRPGGVARRVAAGAAADLCLIDRSWRAARPALSEVQVRLTVRRGEVIWESPALRPVIEAP